VGEASGPRSAGEPRWLRKGLLLLAAGCLLGLFSTEIADTDFWWHLKTGEYILTERSLPVPDPFSYTTDRGSPAYPGEEQVRYFNLTHEWLAQAVWYAVYRLAGFPGVVLFKALLLTGFCSLCGWLAARRSGQWYWGLGAAAGCATASLLFRADRPLLVTFLLVAVFVAVLEHGRPLGVLPLLSLVWANSHGGFFLGWVVVGAYAAGATASRWAGRPAPALRPLWLTLLACIALSAVNPNHVGIFQVLLAYRQSYLTQTLIEWTRPYLWGPPYSFNVLLYACAAVLLAARKRVSFTDWFLFALFAAASLAAFRNIPLIGFLAPVLIATYLPWKPRLPRSAGFAAAALLAGVLATGVLQGHFFQLRAALWRFPEGAAQFLLEHRIEAPMFNTYEYGGYLIWRLWPQQRVFIDGRALNESVYADYQRVLTSAGREVLDRYGVRVIVANAFEYTTGTVYPLVLRLAGPNETEWRLVHQDPQALVFFREPPSEMPLLDKAQVADHLEAECSLHIQKDPELSLCARTLGFLFLQAGAADRARRAFALYLANRPGPDPEAEAAYRQLARQP
jgi:hypothetical protein